MLTPIQLSELEESLEALKRELEAFLASIRSGEAPVELDQSKMGRVSRVDAMQQREMQIANQRSAKVRIEQVQRALARVSESSYGECVRCEEWIDVRRLSARPETPFCFECQRASE